MFLFDVGEESRIAEIRFPTRADEGSILIIIQQALRYSAIHMKNNNYKNKADITNILIIIIGVQNNIGGMLGVGSRGFGVVK